MVDDKKNGKAKRKPGPLNRLQGANIESGKRRKRQGCILQGFISIHEFEVSPHTGRTSRTFRTEIGTVLLVLHHRACWLTSETCFA